MSIQKFSMRNYQLEDIFVVFCMFDELYPEYFASDYQGSELGTLLTNFRISEIRLQPNVSTIAVRTSPKAYQYYAACGFSLQEIHSDYWAKGFDLYNMVFDR